MLLTEAQARTKVCPHMTHCINDAAVTQDGRSAIYAPSTCCASDCMGWENVGPVGDGDQTPVGRCGLTLNPSWARP